MKNKYIVFVWLCFFLVSFRGNHNDVNLERKGKDYAVFFAVKDYQNWDDLRTPIKDAEAIAKVLKNEYDFETKILRNPTKRAIRRKIAALQKKKFNKGDQLLLFFTGHGEFVPSSFNSDEGKGYFIPSDAKRNDEFRESYLYYPDVKPDINDIACDHILIVIDACFSGSFLKYRTGDERPGQLSERDFLIENSMEKRCRKRITSGGLKRTQDGFYHSPFTDNFLKGLNTFGGEDRVLTHHELFVQLADPRNEPQRGYFGHEDSNSKFLFIAKDKETKKENKQFTEHQKADVREWKKAEERNTIEAYQNYILSFRTGLYTMKAYQKIDELRMQKPIPKPRISNFLRPSMTFVQGGIFDMGCTPEQRGNCSDDKKPLRKNVQVKDFSIGTYEVTVAEYLAFTDDTKSNYPKWLEEGNDYHIETGSKMHYKEKGYSRAAFTLPIVGVSWDNAKAYCQWLSQKTGKRFRLPTEAEWEYAARGGERGKENNFNFSGSNTIDEVAWYSSNSDSKTHPVGQKKPNELGIYDMSGNVWEWIEDCWHKDYNNAPTNSKAWLEGDKGNCSRRVLRGGSWYNYNFDCRVSNRNNYNADDRDINFGFRVAQD